MIMIDSKAGQRLAKAKAALDVAHNAYIYSEAGFQMAAQHALDDASVEFDEAAKALADAIMGDGHHLAEDYSS